MRLLGRKGGSRDSSFCFAPDGIAPGLVLADAGGQAALFGVAWGGENAGSDPFVRSSISLFGLALALAPPPWITVSCFFFFFFYPSARRGREEEGEEGKGEKRGKEQKGTGAFVTTPFRVMVFSSTTASDYRVVD